MLLEALSYFVRNFFRTPGAAGFRHVSGETYWRYRIVAESAFFAIASVFLLALIVHPSTQVLTRFAGIMFVPALAAIIALEISRLQRLLHEQIEFADLFYG